MREFVFRCPVCRQRMTADDVTGWVDCHGLHRALMDSAEWQFARISRMLSELENIGSKADEVVGHDHDWVIIERTPYETLQECLSCAAWQLGPPWAVDAQRPDGTTDGPGRISH